MSFGAAGDKALGACLPLERWRPKMRDESQDICCRLLQLNQDCFSQSAYSSAWYALAGAVYATDAPQTLSYIAATAMEQGQYLDRCVPYHRLASTFGHNSVFWTLATIAHHRSHLTARCSGCSGGAGG
jgi:hypothetical protein